MAKAIPTGEQGEDFFLYGSMTNQHTFGRDDMAEGLLKAKSEHVLHSPVDLEETGYHSQYKPCGPNMSVLPATRHFYSRRYQDTRAKTGLACCVAALGALRKLRGRAWNEDILDNALDVGCQLFQDSLQERGGNLRRLILPELNEKMTMNGVEYKIKLVKGVAVWGRLGSGDPLVFDLARGLDNFFKETDAGIMQIPGEFEVAIFQEGGKYFMFDPWPADSCGNRVGLREGGKSYAACFTGLDKMCEHFLKNLPAEKRRKAFSISQISVTESKELPDQVQSFKGVAPNRWIVSGRFHEGDARFEEDRRHKQATPAAIAAIAISHVNDPASWTQDNVDQAVITGDTLYGETVGTKPSEDDAERRDDEDDEGGDGGGQQPGAAMAAGDVLNKFAVSTCDYIETEVFDSKYSGKLNAAEPGEIGLGAALKNMFSEHTHAVVTARGGSVAVWKHDGSFYYFDPRGCDENGSISDNTRAAACVMRVEGSTAELAQVIEGNLAAGSDDNFTISPVTVSATRIHQETGLPEIKLQNDTFEWVKPGTAALLLGARSEHSASGKVATRAGVDDLAGRTLALPAAAAFTAAAAAVPPLLMHQDHMHHFLEAGADYYLEHVKKTGRAEMRVEDLANKFELGANTFSVAVGEPITAPLKLPDPPAKMDEEVEEEEKEFGEGEEEEEQEPEGIKEIKTALYAAMQKPNSLALLVGDYHTLGVWCTSGGQVVAFDPAPTMKGGLLTKQRITKGDELRLRRIAELLAEQGGEGGDDAGDEEGEGEEEEAEGEHKSVHTLGEEIVDPDACPALHIYASPSEFIDRLVAQGGLTTVQRLAPYKLYPVTVTNELTANSKNKRQSKKSRGEGDNDEEEEPEAPTAVALTDDAFGKNFSRISPEVAVLRGRVAQHEYYFMEDNRNNQDAAMAVMGIVVDHIEPHRYWKPSLVDALLKYGDRLYTLSVPRSKNKPRIEPSDVITEFHVVNFIVKLDISPDVVSGDIKAGESGEPLSLKRALKEFFSKNTHGVLCAKDYCVGVWKSSNGKAVCLWEPHAVSATGKLSSSGAAAVVVFGGEDQLADVFLQNLEALARSGHNRFTITPMKVSWTFAPPPPPTRPEGAIPDEGYEHKVLTAYVETGKGRTILRGSRAPDIQQFKRDTVLQSSCGAIVGACMSHVRRPELWTRHTVDEIIKVSSGLFSSSLAALGYEFRPGEDVLLPLQVLKRFVLGVNYVRYELDAVCTGKVEHSDPREMSVRMAIERFLDRSRLQCVVWSASHAVAAWHPPGSPLFCMFEPHACGATGLRLDGDDGAACLMTFTSSKMLSHAYLENIPAAERVDADYHLYSIAVSVQPIRPLGGVAPPLVKPPPGTPRGMMLLPATSKVNLEGQKRLVNKSDCVPKIPPEPANRNSTGWLVSLDGSQFLSADHSMAGKKYSAASRGYQGLACSVMAVVMSYMEDICRWNHNSLGHVLDNGDQLYKDSYLHYKPKGTKYLTLEQVLRKFYTHGGNCLYNAVVFCARHGGVVTEDGVLYSQMNEFFREERSGVFVCGEVAVAVFRTPRGYYMFDPADRDRLGKPVAKQCRGRARACLSKYHTVQTLSARLIGNIPPTMVTVVEETELGPKEVEKAVETKFKIHGMNVSVTPSKSR